MTFNILWRPSTGSRILVSESTFHSHSKIKRNHGEETSPVLHKHRLKSAGILPGFPKVKAVLVIRETKVPTCAENTCGAQQQQTHPLSLHLDGNTHRVKRILRWRVHLRGGLVHLRGGLVHKVKGQTGNCDVAVASSPQVPTRRLKCRRLHSCSL